jgi:hypothetical protein
MTAITYTATPTCARFMQSAAFFRVIAGPVGSGKTTACIFELFRRACEQAPGSDGIRHTRFAVVRQTLKQLKDTVLKDIEHWLKGVCRYKVSESTVYINIGDVQSEWILIPLETPEDQRRLLSMQLTGAWMSEAIEMDVGLIAPLSGRCGRYPTAAQGNPTWHGIIADTNMPSEGSDWHKIMDVDIPPDAQIFVQPGGLTPQAENLEWLVQTADTIKLPVDSPERIAQGRKYYERLARGRGQDWINRYVNALYGDDPSGTAVFRASFKPSFHVVDNLMPVVGRPLIIGQDFGRDPGSVITQVDHKGRLLVLEEVNAEDIGLELHVVGALRPVLMNERYFGRPIAVVGDPAGIAKGSIYEETSFEALKRLGFAAFPAPTNDIDPRLRAVETLLLRQADGGPAIVFDRARCPTLVRAMSGGYRYARTRGGVRKPKPDKNEYSHIADALQYAALAANGRMGEMMARHMLTRRRVTGPKVTAKGWT